MGADEVEGQRLQGLAQPGGSQQRGRGVLQQIRKRAAAVVLAFFVDGAGLVLMHAAAASKGTQPHLR